MSQSSSPSSTLGDELGSEAGAEQSAWEPETIDEVIAWVLLVASGVVLAVAVVVMPLFFRARRVFQIRARSAYLVMLTGVCFITMVAIFFEEQTLLLFDHTRSGYVAFTVYYFALVCSTCCYGSRAIRLAVVYSPRARKSMPWLISERNHLCVCVLLGIASMAVPIYDMHYFAGLPNAESLFSRRSTDHLWKVTVACQCMVVALYPLVRKVEDIFNIAPELRVMMVLKLLVTVGGRLGEDYGSVSITRWINTRTMGFVGTVTMFALSVVYPIQQLWFNPLESSDPKVLRAQASRKRNGPAASTTPSWLLRGARLSSSCPCKVHQETPECRTSRNSSGSGHNFVSAPGPLWTYEKVAAIPGVLAAFEEFSRKALCQESVLFLQDVTAFQAEGFDDLEAKGETNPDVGTSFGDTSSGGGASERQISSFAKMVRKYIVDGSSDEVNISSTDKKAILDVYHAGVSSFKRMSAEDRRLVFSSAYIEVRFVLETNLMAKFVSTEAFKKALAAAESMTPPAS